MRIEWWTRKANLSNGYYGLQLIKDRPRLMSCFLHTGQDKTVRYYGRGAASYWHARTKQGDLAPQEMAALVASCQFQPG